MSYELNIKKPLYRFIFLLIKILPKAILKKLYRSIFLIFNLMMNRAKYIFFSNGQKGGVATFINDHINYLSQTKKDLLLIDNILGSKSNFMKI